MAAGNSIDDLLKDVEYSVSASDTIIDTAEEKASVKNALRMGSDRSVISLTIILSYAAVVLLIVGYGVFAAPDCKGTGAADCLAAWEKQSDFMLTAMTTAVLPIVTLMLGFYFGVEKANENK